MVYERHGVHEVIRRSRPAPRGWVNRVPVRKDNPPSVDELYGLEPVIEPGGDRAAGSEVAQVRTVQCPYCGEPFDTLVDPSSGSTRYIEDCQVCCRPIEFRLDVEEGGGRVSLETYRSD
ncbi:MAG TPA: CPXCG motif-containing cysteine-rich protein [Steroidobacteraceae bacterium]|nr:CPXCG motif-containing cysteine-rich protein [Steroidobacteraceae bacterium]